MPYPHLSFATPRRLPKAKELPGRVVVLDIAFASEAGGASFEKVTRKFLDELGPRLAAWVDHHDSVHHAAFAADSRFVLHTKAEHGACPEIVTPELVARVGPFDAIVCHTDFDGLASAAKWILEGTEPYRGCDDDARAIDTRLGKPSSVGERFDRALRARPRDAALFGLVVRHLATRLADASLWGPIDDAGRELEALEREARRHADRYVSLGGKLSFVDASGSAPYDKTLLLLMGQERAAMSLVVDGDTATFAARFDSGVNFLSLLGMTGGMPTRVSISRSELPRALRALGLDGEAVTRGLSA